MAGSIHDPVDHPAHYGGDYTYEVIKVLDAWKLNFSLGNCVKYIVRAGKKVDLTNATESGGIATQRNILKAKIQDLKKAQWYLTHEIEVAEAELQRITPT